MERYESARAACGLVVQVGPAGTPAQLRLSAAAADVSALELTNQIMLLHTLAYLRRGLTVSRAGGRIEGFTPTPAQIAAFEQLIDF